MSPHRRTGRRAWLLVLGELGAIVGVLYCYMGAAMAGSFTISNPEQLDRWRLVATIYQLLMLVFFVAAMVILVLLARGRR